jgi:hypothetical protein
MGGFAIGLRLESLLGGQSQVERDGVVGVTRYTVVQLIVLAVRH